MNIEARLTDQAVPATRLLDDFIAGCDEEGAVVSFCGLARSTGVGGAKVTALRLEQHPRLTEISLQRIAREAADEFHVRRILVVHRWGLIQPRQVIVLVAAAALHRRQAFLAADYLMDRLKTDAVFWKKEEGIDGGHWIEPTDDDRAARARWSSDGRN